MPDQFALLPARMLTDSSRTRCREATQRRGRPCAKVPLCIEIDWQGFPDPFWTAGRGKEPWVTRDAWQADSGETGAESTYGPEESNEFIVAQET